MFSLSLTFMIMYKFFIISIFFVVLKRSCHLSVDFDKYRWYILFILLSVSSCKSPNLSSETILCIQFNRVSYCSPDNEICMVPWNPGLKAEFVSKDNMGKFIPVHTRHLNSFTFTITVPFYVYLFGLNHLF